jgi:hypothetical protein
LAEAPAELSSTVFVPAMAMTASAAAVGTPRSQFEAVVQSSGATALYCVVPDSRAAVVLVGVEVVPNAAVPALGVVFTAAKALSTSEP